MKGPKASAPPHGTPFERFNAAVKRILAVPKSAVEAREKELHEQRKADRKKRRAAAG